MVVEDLGPKWRNGPIRALGHVRHVMCSSVPDPEAQSSRNECCSDLRHLPSLLQSVFFTTFGVDAGSTSYATYSPLASRTLEAGFSTDRRMDVTEYQYFHVGGEKGRSNLFVATKHGASLRWHRTRSRVRSGIKHGGLRIHFPLLSRSRRLYC